MVKADVLQMLPHSVVEATMLVVTRQAPLAAGITDTRGAMANKRKQRDRRVLKAVISKIDGQGKRVGWSVELKLKRLNRKGE
jgi:hypothetical protein